MAYRIHVREVRMEIATDGEQCSRDCPALAQIAFGNSVRPECFAFNRVGLRDSRCVQPLRCAACRKAYPEEAAR